MSRFEFEVKKNGVEYTVCYGYDKPLSEYFIQVWPEYHEYCDESDETDDETPLFSISNYNTLTRHPSFPDKSSFSNGDIAVIMDEWEVPEEHVNAVLLDMEF